MSAANPPEDAILIVDHTADWALRVRGRDLTELFRYAAVGMARLLVGDLSSVQPDQWREIALEADDAESLLVGWLSELAFLAERENHVYPEIVFAELTPTALKATVHGGRAAEIHKHIKAVTYHNLAIRSQDDSLEVTIVFDV